jgi:hypothetical protein
VQVIATSGPAASPWCRSTYCCIPAIIGRLNVITIGPVADTPVDPPGGVTLTNSVVDTADDPMLSPPPQAATARDASNDPANTL